MRLSFIKADLSLVAEARCAAEALYAKQLDLLLFTAGIFSSLRRETAPDVLERGLGIRLRRFTQVDFPAVCYNKRYTSSRIPLL